MAEFNFGQARPIVNQRVVQYQVDVPSDTAVPLSHDLDNSKHITTFLVSNPSYNGQSVYLGFTSMVRPSGASQGIEIPPGTAPSFQVYQETRQLYELQVLLAGLNNQTDLVKVPFMTWDLTQIWLISSANATETITQSVVIAAFPKPYM